MKHNSDREISYERESSDKFKMAYRGEKLKKKTIQYHTLDDYWGQSPSLCSYWYFGHKVIIKCLWKNVVKIKLDPIGSCLSIWFLVGSLFRKN